MDGYSETVYYHQTELFDTTWKSVSAVIINNTTDLCFTPNNSKKKIIKVFQSAKAQSNV